MNNKKKMVLGAAFIVAIMALAGVGYAAFGDYKGSTESAENDYDVDYVVVALGAASYTGDADLLITYDTETEYVTTPPEGIQTTYTWTGSSALTHIATISIPESDGDTYTLTITAQSAAPSGFKLYYKASAETFIDNPTPTAAGWTEYTTPVTADLTTALGSETSTTYTISWALVPTAASSTTAPTTVATLPAFEYLVEASQPSP